MTNKTYVPFAKAARYPVMQISGKNSPRTGLCIGEYPGGKLHVEFRDRKGKKTFAAFLPNNVARVTWDSVTDIEFIEVVKPR